MGNNINWLAGLIDIIDVGVRKVSRSLWRHYERNLKK